MPFAAATSINTFDDGTSEVIVQFKDGVNTVNTSDGGFSVPSDETITSSSLQISTHPLITNGFSRVGVESGLPIWDPVLNNQATSFDDITNFTYQDSNGAPVPLQFSSESIITDFETDESDFENMTAPFIKIMPLQEILFFGNMVTKMVEHSLQDQTLAHQEICAGERHFRMMIIPMIRHSAIIMRIHHTLWPLEARQFSSILV